MLNEKSQILADGDHVECNSAKLKEKDVDVNDTIELICENENSYSKKSFNLILIFLIFLIGQARVLQIKEDKGERFYYVHFLNLEKRMDKWIPHKMIKRNFGKKAKDFDGVIKFFISIFNF
jgi:hypothetical protein